MSELNFSNFPDPKIVKQSVDFTFPIYTFDLSHEIDTDVLIDKVKLLRQDYATSTTTNVVCKSGWRSPYFSKYANNEISLFSDVIGIVVSKLKSINSFDVTVSNLWSIIYGQDDYTNWHNHGSIWDRLAYNVVVYLTDSKSPLVVKSNPTNIDIFPTKGMMVVMHPFTYHMVEPIKDSEDRIVLALNFEHK